MQHMIHKQGKGDSTILDSLLQGVTAFVSLLLLGLELGVEGADFGVSGLSSLRFSDRSKNGCLDGDPGWEVVAGMSEAFPTQQGCRRGSKFCFPKNSPKSQKANMALTEESSPSSMVDYLETVLHQVSRCLLQFTIMPKLIANTPNCVFKMHATEVLSCCSETARTQVNFRLRIISVRAKHSILQIYSRAWRPQLHDILLVRVEVAT